MLQKVHLHRPQRQIRPRIDACWRCMARQIKQSIGMPRQIHSSWHQEQQQQLGFSWQTTGLAPLGWTGHDTTVQKHMSEEARAATMFGWQHYLQSNQQVQGALDQAPANSTRSGGRPNISISKLRHQRTSACSHSTRAGTAPAALGSSQVPTSDPVVAAEATGLEDSNCDSNASTAECAAAHSSPCEPPPLQQDHVHGPGAVGLEGSEQFSHGQQAQQQQVLPSKAQAMQQQQDEGVGSIDTPGVRAALAALKWYKSVLSPSMASTCRFQPTCSQYAMDSYRRYGVAKGTVLTAWRLLRCNPWGGSGYDPSSWPPKGLAPVFTLPYSAEVAVVLGTMLFVRFTHALLFE